MERRVTRCGPERPAAGLPAGWLGTLACALVGAACAGPGSGGAHAEEPGAAATSPTHAETMARLGFVRHGRAWRTAQEIEIIEREERSAAARRDWKVRLERLRRRLDVPTESAAAFEEIRGISDPLAVQPLAEALLAEPVPRVRGVYIEALSRISSSDAFASLVAVALDHPDAETRIAAVERLSAIGASLAAPPFIAALASADNAQVNRAAEALGRLGMAAAVLPLIAALETEHASIVTDGRAPGSTSATFTPSGGGFSMGGGPKRVMVKLRNDRVLEALIALTGMNFQWDQAAWRAWLANERSLPPDFDLRRG